MTKEKIQELIKNLDPINNKITRMRAAITLGDLGKEANEATEALLFTLKEDESSKVRESAAKALGQIVSNDSTVATSLVDSMLDDEAESVRLIAAESLGELGDIAVPALLSVLRKETNVGVIEKTLETLGKIGLWAKSEEPDLINSIISEIITVIGKYTIESLHIVAVETIVKMGETAITPLLKAYKTEESVDVKTVIDVIFERLAQQLGYRNRAALIRVNDY